MREVLRRFPTASLVLAGDGEERPALGAQAAALGVAGRRGLLVPPEDPAALAKAILAILEDPCAAAAMGEAGRRRAQQFSLDLMLERLDAVYWGGTSGPRS